MTRYPPKDDLVENIGRYIREHGHEHWSHLPGKYPPPTQRSRPQQIKNPWAPPATRPSSLKREAGMLYNATSFMTWHFGVTFDTHLTVLWRAMGIESPKAATGILGRFNHETRKWMAVGGADHTGHRIGSRVLAGPTEHCWIYVHENARDSGFHTHQLMVVPPSKAAPYAVWARAALVRLSGASEVPDTAIHFSPNSKKFGLRPYVARNDSDAVERQWSWFRYLVKSCDPGHVVRGENGRVQTVRQILKLPDPYIRTDDIAFGKLAGVSENIGAAAQRRAGYKSRLQLGDWGNLYDGAELQEYRRRQADIQYEQTQNEFLAHLDI